MVSSIIKKKKKRWYPLSKYDDVQNFSTNNYINYNVLYVYHHDLGKKNKTMDLLENPKHW